MTSLLGGAAAPGFDDPLEMLEACHGRIRAQCSTLQKLQQHLPLHGCDEQARQAAQAILRYFDSAGQYHHQDEEHDLFPALVGTMNMEASELVARLLEEHKGMEAAWQVLRPLLQALADGRSDVLDAAAAAHFVAVYERHIELENGKLLPLAARLLSAAQLEIIGRNMAARRGVEFGNKQ
jgi:hemerythrin-like domain-containing protein